MKRNTENVIAVSINNSQTGNKEENIKLLEKQVTSAIFCEKITKFYLSDKANIECKICFKN